MTQQSTKLPPSLQDLVEALNAGIMPIPTQNLNNLLSKLGIKSAKRVFGGILKVEDIEVTLKNVTFDEDKLKLWKHPKK